MTVTFEADTEIETIYKNNQSGKKKKLNEMCVF